MDGDSTDWEAYPVLIDAPDNLDGAFPSEVGAVVTDIVDVKTVKAVVMDNVLYTYFEFWGGPAWPNNAYENDHEGTLYYASRGYYHLLLDIDNDPTTGWVSDWYEAHYTTVGYLISQGQPYETIGSEVMIEWGARTRDAYEVANGSDYVRNHDYWGADWEEYDGATDLGSTYDMYNYEVIDGDSATIMGHDGMLLNDPSITDGRPDWMAHAWGHDFLEVGHSLRAITNYFEAKDGRTIFNDGDVIGFCALIETPVDDWGVDMTTRGALIVGADPTTDVATSDLVVNKFTLENNYPNPFNPETNINFSVPNTSKVSLVIYNTLGQKVKTLVNNQILSGYQTAVWDGKNDFGNSVPSGIYYYRMESGSNLITKSMVLLK